MVIGCPMVQALVMPSSSSSGSYPSAPLASSCPFLRSSASCMDPIGPGAPNRLGKSSACPFLRACARLPSRIALSFHQQPPITINAGLEEDNANHDEDDVDPSSAAPINPVHGAVKEDDENGNSRLVVLGLTVHTTSIEMRERLAVPEADWASSSEQLSKLPHIVEAGILSTCNRMEVYLVALSYQRGVQEVLQWMCQLSGIPQHELRDHLFILQEEEATQHLFRVASGLDSLVLGEGQILAQVKQVLQLGQSSPGFGRILTGLFKQAIGAGKRVRSQTSITTGAVSVSSAAVELAALHWPPGSSLATASIAIVGAGKMAQLLVKHLTSKGCTSMIIVNRTQKRVQELQALFPQASLSYRPLRELIVCVGEADIVFTCTASKAPLLAKSAVEALPPAATHIAAVRHFIDISVPRNVSKCVAELATSAIVHNVDDLAQVVAANKEERRRKALEAQVVVEEEIKKFTGWRRSLKTLPTIKKLRAYAEKARADEFQKCMGKLDLTPKQKQLTEEMSRAIVSKLLHGPMAALKCDGKDSTKTWADTLANMHALERVFELHSDHPAPMEEEYQAKVDEDRSPVHSRTA